jgi:hypothetical protein
MRATIVEVWIRRVIQAAGRRGWLGPPHANGLNGNVTTLVSLYSTVYNIANIPIPFNYAHFMTLMMVMYLTLYTVVIMQTSGFYTPLWTFVWGFILFSCDELAREIECPFGLDDNDIDLEAHIARIEEELDVVMRSMDIHESLVRESAAIETALTASVDIDSSRVSVQDTINSSTSMDGTRAIQCRDAQDNHEVVAPERNVQAPMLRYMLTDSLSNVTEETNEDVKSSETAGLLVAPVTEYGSSTTSTSGTPLWL